MKGGITVILFNDGTREPDNYTYIDVEPGPEGQKWATSGALAVVRLDLSGTRSQRAVLAMLRAAKELDRDTSTELVLGDLVTEAYERGLSRGYTVAKDEYLKVTLGIKPAEGATPP